MKTKDKTVNLNGLVYPLNTKLYDIERCIQIREGEEYSMTITSACDGKHMENSKHYSGNAIDIRTFDMNFAIYNKHLIQNILGNDYDVVLEDNHIHIEYDPKKQK